jgi:hypothetical protein
MRVRFREVSLYLQQAGKFLSQNEYKKSNSWHLITDQKKNLKNENKNRGSITGLDEAVVPATQSLWHYGIIQYSHCVSG